MIICFPSTAPNALGYCHFSPNLFAIISHSSLLDGTFKYTGPNRFDSQTSCTIYEIALVDILYWRLNGRKVSPVARHPSATETLFWCYYFVSTHYLMRVISCSITRNMDLNVSYVILNLFVKPLNLHYNPLTIFVYEPFSSLFLIHATVESFLTAFHYHPIPRLINAIIFS